MYSAPDVVRLDVDQAEKELPGLKNHFAPAVWLGTQAMMSLYISENQDGSLLDEKNLVWQATNLTYGKWDYLTKEMDYLVPDSVKIHNASLYAHLYYSLETAASNVMKSNQLNGITIYKRQQLTRYMPKIVNKKKKLVGMDLDSIKKEQENEENSSEFKYDLEGKYGTYWWPNISISIINTMDAIPNNLPGIYLNEGRFTPDRKYYLPFVYFNEFWLMRDDLVEINSTTHKLNLTLGFQPITWTKYQLTKQFGESFKIQENYMDVSVKESDSIKKMFLKTNPYLLVITMTVSLLHSIFDFLAFKNDIQFWRQKKDMEGMSFRSLGLNLIFQIVIFFYLLDNNTSYMILVSTGLGLLIEIWKLKRMATIDIDFNKFPFIHIKDKSPKSELSSKTHEYDAIAFKYLGYILYPCLLGYSIYSLLYETHKSWYSYILGTIVGFIYAFGFISMTPQLYINYKLKSVAHMPWRTFIYKALNTFIDDMFAFIIEMPTLHRIACLRDDVIFFIYLYQKWIYPEDKTRANEYGQVGNTDDNNNDNNDDNDDNKESIESKKQK